MSELSFFVYGSMSEGLVHFKKIEAFVVRSVPARVTGSAYRLKVGYPVVLEQGFDQIIGTLVTLNASDLLVNLLDQFHGFSHMDPSKSLYLRKEAIVSTEVGHQRAHVYFLNPSKLPTNAEKIVNGDWQSSLLATPSILEQLSDRQRAYINRLGSSTGREIIPIDLGLYRELMKLELIVDKGRRLALSKLGHEVHRYLS